MRKGPAESASNFNIGIKKKVMMEICGQLSKQKIRLQKIKVIKKLPRFNIKSL